MDIIGVIGGNGVAATNKLCELIEIELTQTNAFRDAHHPEMIIWQATKAPSRSLYLEGKGESFIPDYINIAKALKKCGATMLCMCCNTAHYAIDEISQKADISFINLIEGVAQKIKTMNIKKAGLMASDGCCKYKIYDKYFQQICPDVKLIYPDNPHQKLVTKGICNIKNKHRFDEQNVEERPKNIFKNVSEHLKTKGAEIVISGCTDIRVDYYNPSDIDSLEVLKDLILRKVKFNEQQRVS